MTASLRTAGRLLLATRIALCVRLFGPRFKISAFCDLIGSQAPYLLVSFLPSPVNQDVWISVYDQMDSNVSRKYCPLVRSHGESSTMQTVTYALIYDFLSRRSHTKAAEAVKKVVNGANGFGGALDSTSRLEDIVKEWNGSQRKLATVQ